MIIQDTPRSRQIVICDTCRNETPISDKESSLLELIDKGWLVDNQLSQHHFCSLQCKMQFNNK